MGHYSQHFEVWLTLRLDQKMADDLILKDPPCFLNGTSAAHLTGPLIRLTSP